MANFQTTTVLADVKEPSIRSSTRYDYLMRYMTAWFDARQSRSYAVICAVVGLLLLVKGIPALAVIPFAAASYFYTRSGLQNFILTSQRKIIYAD